MEARVCVCDKCGTVAHSIPESQHRRCSGSPGKEPVEKYKCIAPQLRGKWVAK